MTLTISDVLLLIAIIGGFSATVYTVSTYVQKVVDRLDRMSEGLDELEVDVENHEHRITAIERHCPTSGGGV